MSNTALYHKKKKKERERNKPKLTRISE